MSRMRFSYLGADDLNLDANRAAPEESRGGARWPGTHRLTVFDRASAQWWPTS